MTNFSILISYSLFYVSLILFYFLSIFPSFFSFFFFFLFFSPPHTHVPLIFFFFISFFHLFPTSSTHVPFFFLYFLLSSFSLPLHTPERSTQSPTLSHPSKSLLFFLTVRKLQGREKMMMMKKKMMMMKKKMKMIET